MTQAPRDDLRVAPMPTVALMTLQRIPEEPEVHGRFPTVADLRHALAPSAPNAVSMWRLGRMTLVFIAAVLWNVLSPVKAWALTRYGFARGEVGWTKSVEWTTEIDRGLAESVYAAAGMDAALLLPPDRGPVRFINVYLDIVRSRETQHWAHLVGVHHNDYFAGRFCRATLRSRPHVLNQELSKWTQRGFNIWGMQTYDYVIEEADCAVQEVAEGMLCLKGMNASDFINLDWKTKLRPGDPDVDSMLAQYQQLVLPDLNECLARREYLHTASADPTTAQLQLAREIARNFSLDLHNRGGNANLGSFFVIERGFVDISGALSGRRSVQLMGAAPLPTDHFTTALSPIREVLWLCSSALYANVSLTECVDHWSVILPGVFVGLVSSSANVPINASREFAAVTTRGVVNIMQHVDDSRNASRRIEYLTPAVVEPLLSVQTAYRDSVDRQLFEHILGDQLVWLDGDELLNQRCYVRDGCFSACHGGSSANGLDMFATYQDASGCVRTVMQPPTPGFVSDACYGLGTGNSSILFTFAPIAIKAGKVNVSHYIFNDTADPFAILACMAGGRLPWSLREEAPADLTQLLDSSTNIILAQTFTRGSEELFLNFYSVIGLVGCILFAVWVFVAIVQWFVLVWMAQCHPATRLQLIISIFRTNLASTVWERGSMLLRCFGFVSIVAWHLGASESKCTWMIAGQDIWNMTAAPLPPGLEPEYACIGGRDDGPFVTWKEVARLHAVSYNLFAIVFQGRCLRGLTRNARGFFLGLILLGMAPLLVIATVITHINRARVDRGQLTELHNQFFISALWGAALLFMRLCRRYICKAFSVVFALVGVGRQSTTQNQLLRFVVGPYYYTLTREITAVPTQVIPLSVCLESSRFLLERVDLTSHQYHPFDAAAAGSTYKSPRPSVQNTNELREFGVIF